MMTYYISGNLQQSYACAGGTLFLTVIAQEACYRN